MMRKQLTHQEIKKVQLEVLQEFHNFCIANSLKYSLCAGTLLGAVRHKGYIPWDDDIDVMMPRCDYQRFLEIYHSEKFTLYHYTKQRNYMVSYAKLCDNRTIVMEGVVYESTYGVDIDIFPLDYFPSSLKESQKWSNRLAYLKNIREVKNIRFSRHRSMWKNVLLAFYKLLSTPISMKWIVKRVDVVARRYEGSDSGFWGNMTNGYRMKERNPKAQFLIDVYFEGNKFKAIENYDVYLKNLFSDYMILPPEEKRVSTHSFKAYWK